MQNARIQIYMLNKHEIAAMLEEIGTFLSLQGENPFKVRAYHNAARSLEGAEEDLEKLVEEERLEELPGVGAHIAEKITTLVRTGRLPYYEKLKKSIPPILIELLRVPGLGEKKAKLLYKKLKIKTVEDLAAACEQGKVAKLTGFGETMQKKILEGISKMKSYGRRMLWEDAMEIAEPILKALSDHKDVKKAAIAGSVRRKLETIGDLDFLAASSNPQAVMKWFIKQPWVKSVISTGPDKSSVRLRQGVQADLRVIPESEFAFTLLYFTGSKEHNIHMRNRANGMGVSLSEYGFEPLTGRRKKTVTLKLPKKTLSTEEEIFNVLGLEYIPPELREDMGEIEAAAKGKLPTLIEEKDIRGSFHCHTTESDGHNTLEEMVKAAQALKWEYIGISDHSKSSFQAYGLDEKKLFAQGERIRKLNRSKKFSTYVFAGLECDILNEGKLDFPDRVLKELDFVIVSIHRSFKLDEKTMTARLIKAIENPYTTMVGHLTGRLLLRREPYALNTAKVIDACIANHKIIELNSHPMRLDMDWRLWHRAAERGLKCSINPDAHSTDELRYVYTGVNWARKGWLRKQDVINTLPLSKMQTYLKHS